jgi:putative PEP-CTERM system TPR-repeat lipoprotein
VIPNLLQAKLDLGQHAEVLGEIDQSGATTPRLLTLKGQALLRGGDPTQARRAFEDALAGDPAEGLAYLGLAQIGLMEHDDATVAKWLTDGVKAAPRERRLWLAKGDIDASAGRLDDAMAAFDAAAKLPSGDLLAELGKVRVHLLAKELDKAEPIVEEVLRKAPKSPLANYLKATIAYQRDDLQGAEGALQVVQQNAPDYPPAMLLMGTVKYRDKQYAQAEAQLAPYIGLDPNNVSARTVLAASRLAQNNATGAVEALIPVADGLTDAQALTLLGNAQMRAGDPAGATVSLEKAAQFAPDAANVRMQLALSLMASGETEGAMSQLRTAIDLNQEMIESEALLALIQLREGKLDAARETTQEMIRKHPDKPMGYNLLGTIELAAKDTSAAKSAFEKALDVDPKFSAAVMNLARLAISAKNPEEARERLTKLLEADPGNEPALLGLAELSYATNDKAQAFDLLQRARSQSSTALAPRISLARLALMNGHAALAETAASEAVAIAPENPDAVQVHAQVELVKRGPVAAVGTVNKLSNLLENDAPGERLLVLAGLQMAVGQLENAQRSYDRALSNLADPLPARVGLVRVALQLGDMAGAATHLNAIRVAKAPPSLVAELEGDSAMALKNIDRAADAYRRAVKAGSRDGVLKLQALELQRGNADVAEATLSTWLKTHPDDVDAQLALGNVYLAQGDNKAAVATYEALQKQVSGNVIALNNLAWLYFSMADPRAEAVAREALRVAPDNPDVADTLGWILAQGDDPREAISLLERAAAARAENGSVQYHLAFVYEKQRRLGEARRALERALATGAFPERTEAAAMKERLAVARES